jgi:hypothetical protein
MDKPKRNPKNKSLLSKKLKKFKLKRSLNPRKKNINNLKLLKDKSPKKNPKLKSQKKLRNLSLRSQNLSRL